MDIRSSLKKLPSVEKILGDERVACRAAPGSRKGAARIAREVIARHREKLKAGRSAVPSGRNLHEAIVSDVVRELAALSGGGAHRVVNATGVVLHTNLGRAVLGDETRSAIDAAAAGYGDLEVDLASGERVERGRRAARLLSLITGAEDALVLNNNAAAILLAVRTLASEGGVAISRGELVEIGGSFRLPEILQAAAGKVIEVGTTNRTHLADYERAVRAGARLLLKVHTSNYRVVGYTNDVALGDLAELARRARVPVMYDQGSGVLRALRLAGIAGEECIEDALSSGVDLVSFSTDKVLGGPQGGAIVGRERFIREMKRNHLSRALRVDKLRLAGLERLLLHYWEGSLEGIPAFKMITETAASVRSRAERLAALIARGAAGSRVTVEDSESSIGGGSYPINPLPTAVVRITVAAGSADKLSRALRAGSPAVMVRIKGNAILVDPRTVLEGEEDILIEKLTEALAIVLRRE